MSENKIIYSINIDDVQTVANQELGRPLKEIELLKIEQKIGDYFNWYESIQNTINSEIKNM